MAVHGHSNFRNRQLGRGGMFSVSSRGLLPPTLLGDLAEPDDVENFWPLVLVVGPGSE